MVKSRAVREMTAKDYRATYVAVSVLGALATGVVVLMAIVWRLFRVEETLTIAGLVVTATILPFNAAILPQETLKRMGKRRIFVFYLISGQVLSLLPQLLYSSILNLNVSSTHVLVYSSYGLFLALASYVAAFAFKNMRARILGTKEGSKDTS